MFQVNKIPLKKREFMEGLIPQRGFWSFMLFALVLDQSVARGGEQVLVSFMQAE